MKKDRFFLFAVYCLLSTVFLWSCGGGAGSPGSSGSEKTGILPSTPQIIRETPDIDVISRNGACDGEPENPLTAERGILQFKAEKLNPNSTFDPFPATLTDCTITYKQPNSDPSAPKIEALSIYPMCSINEDDNSCIVTVIDIERKQQYVEALMNGLNSPAAYPTKYTAYFKCNYTTNNGKSGNIETQYDIWLSDLLSCD